MFYSLLYDAKRKLPSTEVNRKKTLLILQYGERLEFNSTEKKRQEGF